MTTTHLQPMTEAEAGEVMDMIIEDIQAEKQAAIAKMEEDYPAAERKFREDLRWQLGGFFDLPQIRTETLGFILYCLVHWENHQLKYTIEEFTQLMIEACGPVSKKAMAEAEQSDHR